MVSKKRRERKSYATFLSSAGDQGREEGGGERLRTPLSLAHCSRKREKKRTKLSSFVFFLGLGEKRGERGKMGL